MTRESAAVGFVHAGLDAQFAFERELAVRRFAGEVLHTTAACDGERDYGDLLRAVRELAARAARIVLGCPGHDACAAWLRDDLLAEQRPIAVERSDAAGARALLRTGGPIGVLAEDAERPVIVDYLGEILAQAEQSREIRSSAHLGPLRDCGVLFVPRSASRLEGLDAIRAGWGRRPLVSALQATLDELLEGKLCA